MSVQRRLLHTFVLQTLPFRTFCNRSLNELEHAFQTLGVSQHSSMAEIQAAYRAKDHAIHPDRHTGCPDHLLKTHQLARLNDAYRLLTTRPRTPQRRCFMAARFFHEDGKTPPSTRHPFRLAVWFSMIRALLLSAFFALFTSYSSRRARSALSRIWRVP